MDKERLKQANVDYENGMQRFAGKEALYEKYLKKFKEDPHFEATRMAYEKEDYETMLKEAHTLKGVAGTLGLLDLFDACANLVTALRSGSKEELSFLFEKVKIAYENVIDVL